MCGFAGVLDLNGRRAPDRTILQKMTSLLAHRGPDGEGFHIDSKIGLGFRRLAIIDLETGNQPMSHDRYVIVFNGEIYNFLELRRTLESKGRRFKTRSDTEVLLQLFEEKGERCLEDLIGMFAFAIWDKKEDRLFLARDRLGKKPLYWAQINDQFLFASEIKAIAHHPDFKPELDPHALDHYLTFQAIPSPMTIYKSIRRLPPASFLWVSSKGAGQPQHYWRLSFTPKFQGSPQDAQDRILELLRQATRQRLISDVPLGAFLSGGIDSGLVVAMMAQASEQPVKTFTIAFNEKEFSEAQAARQTAQHFGCRHQEFLVQANMIESLPKILWHHDQPFADPSALPSYFVARETRRAVTVALNGDGGDEAFGGYLRYAADRWSLELAKWLPHGSAHWANRALVRLAPANSRLVQYAQRWTQALHPNIFETNFRLFCYFNPEQKRELFGPNLTQSLSSIAGREYMENLANGASAGHPMDGILAADYRGYLPECLLVKMDIASMSNSLEARSPFLDHRLAEFAATLPFEWKVKGLTTKWILRQAAAKILPREILERRKMGFGIPVHRWFRGELQTLSRRLLLDDNSSNRHYFEPRAVTKLFEEHLHGRQNHGYRLWALLCFELWHRICIDKTIGPSDLLR